MHRESFTAVGHEQVTATHESTLELTTDDWLTPAGDCIVGVDASAAPSDFHEGFVEACQSPTARITLELATSNEMARITGRGHPDLSFVNTRSMVARTSAYVDDRTIMVDADRSAADLERSMVRALQHGEEITATIRVQE